jgi:eukaryotic-like serine/threonine-protein kinase
VADPTAMVGARAPAFSLTCTTGQLDSRRPVSLTDYQGRWLLLLFYPRDFSLV